MGDFYCGCCGQFKDESLKRKREAGRTPICVTCLEKQVKAIARKDYGRVKAKHRKAQKSYLTGKAKTWLPKE